MHYFLGYLMLVMIVFANLFILGFVIYHYYE